MIDHGPVALAELIAFGNWWHGHYDTVNGFVSRAGVAQAFLNGSSEAAIQREKIGYDAHLVDFSMPEIETPEDESAQGMLRWNKAILYGRDKYYSILGGFRFGVGGWPYRAPDGSVWHLQARMGTSGVLNIHGDLLKSHVNIVATVRQSITVPTDTNAQGLFPWLDESVSNPIVNFNPKGGAQAAVHRYGIHSALMWLVEVAVAGGSKTVAPTITCTLSYTGATQFTTGQTGGSESLIQDTAINPYTGEIFIAPESPDYPLTHPTGTWTSTRDQVLAVTYSSEGERQRVSIRKDVVVSYIHDAFVPVIPYDTYQQERHVRTISHLSFVVNEQRMSDLWFDVTESNSYLTRINHLPARVIDSYYQSDVLGNVFNGYFAPAFDLTQPGWLDNTSDMRFVRLAANAFALVSIAQAFEARPFINRILAYVSPDGSGVFGWPTPWDRSDLQVPIAVDPITGAFVPTITRYF